MLLIRELGQVKVEFTMQDLENGLLQEDVKILIAISLHVGEDLTSYPSLEKIAEYTGLTRKTVGKKVKQLQEVGYIYVDQHREGKKTYNRYTINNKKISTQVKEKKYNSNDMLKYFCKKHEETYNIKYSPSYQRDCSMIKSKIINQYKREEIELTLDYLFKNYHIWANKNYPTPTIGGLCSFIFNDAHVKMKLEQQKQQEIQEQEVTELDINEYLERVTF